MRPAMHSRTRFLLAAGGFIALLLSSLIFLALRRFEDQSALDAFRSAAQERFHALENNVDQTLDNIIALGALYDSSHLVERDEFARFSSRLMDHDRTIQALEWIPRVPHHLRSAFELAARRDGLSSFQITDHPQRGIVKAGERSEYFPILFVEPFQGNETSLGFDLASDPVRREALERSADSGQMVATGTQTGFIVFRPYYRGGVDPLRKQARHDALAGFVLGVFRMKDVVESKTLNVSAVSGLVLVVFDRDAPRGQKLLYPTGAAFDSLADLPKGPIETATIAVAGRTWQVAAYPLSHAFAPARSRSWSILVAELMAIALFATYLHLTLNRKQAIEQTVAERTEELHAAVDNLERAKKAAEKSETRYRKLLEVSPDAILVTHNLAISMANPAALRLFRVSSAGELAGRQFTEFVKPEFRAVTEDTSLRLHSTETQLQPHEMQLVFGETVVDVEISAASYLDDEGPNVQSIIRDITERKRASDALQVSETRLRGITDSAQDAIIMMDPRGLISFWNPAAEMMLGYRNEEAMGMNLHQLLTPDRYLAAHHAAFPEFLRTGRGNAIGVTVELAARRKDGCEIAIDLSLSAMCLNGAWHAIGIIRDISERKQAEQALRESEENFRQLTENIREVFFVLDPAANHVLYVSPAYEQIWGASRETVYQDPDAWQKAIHPDDLEQTLAAAAIRPEGAAAEFEYRIRTPDGLEKWIRSRSFPVRNPAGELIRIVGVAEEITERKRYEAQLIEAREGAEAANLAKSMFLTTMSHELRTPLNAILGFAELLEVEMEDREIHHWDEDVGKIRKAGNHLLALISDVMDLSKIEAGKIEIHAERFDIASLVQDVTASVAPLAAKNQVEVQVISVPAMVNTDRMRVQQCLLNLVGNACKFTHNGRVLVEAHPDSGSGGAWYTVRVTDSGIGIREEDRDKLFGYFTQLDSSSSRKYGGTGLGLAISRRLSRLMGGDITVESVPGQGSTFTFRFPTGAGPQPTLELESKAAAVSSVKEESWQ
jgi:PAS domain S-box-containing protein